MLLCTKIKLEITEQEKRTLEFMQAKCRGLYNWWVMKLRDGERWDVYQAKVSLQESKQHDPELEQVYGKLLQEVYFRLDKAMKAFYRCGWRSFCTRNDNERTSEGQAKSVQEQGCV